MSYLFTPKRAMFIFAHPDDIEFGTAGTAAKWAKYGSHVTYVLLTDGNVGSHEQEMTREQLAMIRRAEQEEAAQIAGVSQCIFLGHHDGLLQPTLELRKELVKLIRTYRPNVVVCGDPLSFFPGNNRINHPDHRAAATATIDAVFPAAEMNLLYPDFYEQGIKGHKINYLYIAYPTYDANYWENISETIEIKLTALRAHKSQLEDWDPTERIKNWAKENGQRVGFEYAEQFKRIMLKEPSAEDQITE